MYNNNFKPFVITLIFLFRFFFFFGQDDFILINNTEQIKNNIKNTAEKTETIESGFVQKKHLSMLEEVITSKGHFCYKKESKIRWEYIDPIEYLIIINSGIFTIKDGDNISEYDTKSNIIFKEINNILINSVQGNILISNDFDITFSENSNFYRAKLVPLKKEMLNFLTAIYIYFDKADFTVTKIKIMESSDDFTSISFINKKLNEEISDKRFSVR